MKNKNTLPLICLLAVAMLTTGCPPSGPPAPPPQTASVSISIKNYISGGAGIQCPATINWRYEPVSLTGTQGKDTAFDTTGTYSGSSSQIETSNGYPVYGCIYSESQIGMRAGNWKIRGSNGAWTAECQKQLTNGGLNNAQFTINRAGCQ